MGEVEWSANGCLKTLSDLDIVRGSWWLWWVCFADTVVVKNKYSVIQSNNLENIDECFSRAVWTLREGSGA